MELAPQFERLRRSSVAGVLARTAGEAGERLAVIDGERQLTYSELLLEARALAAGLQKQGIARGDQVAICLPNWHEFVVSYFALAILGAVLVPINTRYRSQEAEHILEDSQATTLMTCECFGDQKLLAMYRGLRAGLPALQRLVVARSTGSLEPSELEYSMLLRQGSLGELDAPEIDPKEDLFAILYTSGTTGVPKGAMLTHSNLVETNVVTAALLECTPEDVFLVAVPLNHIFGIGASILLATAAGASEVLMDVYKAPAALELIERHRVTIHHGVPTMFVLELNSPDFERRDLSSLRTGIMAAAPCPIEVVKAIRARMGCNIIVSYGMTEASPSLTITRFDDSDEDRAETVGRVQPGVELRLVDDKGNNLPPGEVGEVLARSCGVMKGYFRKPEETKEVLTPDGWFSTGDLGVMDARGFLRIVGRKKEMIIRGGYNIYPREVEEVIYRHPDVLEAAVVGVDDSFLGERTCACVKPKPGAQLSAEDLRELCRASLADYKVPDLVHFFEEFPMTGSGKLVKRELRRLVAAREGGGGPA